MADRAYFLPVRRGAAMFRWDGRALTECPGTYRETPYKDCFTDLETDTDVRVRLASDAHPNAARHVFEQWRGSFDREPSLVREVAIPTDLGYPTPHCALKDNVLFIGGKLETGRLVSFDLEDPAARWRVLAPLADPDETGAHNTVRAVCVDGDRLLCVDTLWGDMSPRWLVFDVSNPRDVYPKQTVAIEPNTSAARTGEYFERVIVSGPFVVAHTRSPFVDDWSYWLRFFDRRSLRSLGVRAQSRLNSWDFARADMIAGCDELLAECRRASGVWLFDLRAMDFSGPSANASPREPVRRIERAQFEPTHARFVDQAHLVVVWRATDGTHDVTLESV